jgi:glycosyltransferase involved in cell wall biosynthesis
VRRGQTGGGVVAANPSSNPEVGHAAAALASAGLLSRYHIPLATTERHERRLRRVLPGRAGDAVVREVRRRRLPDEIPASSIRSTATFADMQRVAGSRMRLPERANSFQMRHHRARFDAGVARGLTDEDRAILAISEASVRTLRRANELGIPTLVDCPLGHSGYIRALMREEAQLQPRWAPTLQGHTLSDRDIREQEEVLRRADTLLVLSTHAKETFVRNGVDEAKMIMTPLGVDLELFHPRPRPDDGRFRIIFVGQITQRKGLSYLIEAFKNAAIPDSELMLVGAPIGDYRVWRDEPGIRHVPAVPRSELPSYYRLADVYVLPSLAEGFPLTTMEAMASGLPVIVSTHTFAHDVVTDGEDGYIVPIRDAESICTRLRTLADEPDRRRQMGEAALATAQRYSWTRYGERIVDLFRGLDAA